jgi:hypothetical protein
MVSKDRKLTAIAGVLYVLGTVFGVLSVVTTSSFREGGNLLEAVSQNPNQMITGSMFILLMGLALSLMAVFLYPVLSKQNSLFALGYVVFRGGLEMVTYIASTISWLFLLPLSRYAMNNNSQTDAGVMALADTLFTSVEFSTIMTIVFIIGALMFYATLYQGRLVPRWLSGWGLIMAVPFLIAFILQMYGVVTDSDTTFTIMIMPHALQEMVLAVWMIVKGFKFSGIAESVK